MNREQIAAARKNRRGSGMLALGGAIAGGIWGGPAGAKAGGALGDWADNSGLFG